jgi:hypothetical protein
MACDTKDYRPVGVPLARWAAYRDGMTALETRPEQLRVDRTTARSGPFDGLVDDAREVAVALTALRAHSERRAVRIPAQAFGIVEHLGSYGA